jgi:hypothetical protein
VGNGIQYHANHCQCSLNMSVCISIGKEFSGTTMVFCIGVSFPIPPTGCCYSFLDLGLILLLDHLAILFVMSVTILLMGCVL